MILKIIVVRAGKGNKDRTTVLPEECTTKLREQIERVRALHKQDMANGCGEVFLPNALARKYPEGCNRIGLAVSLASLKAGARPQKRRIETASPARERIEKAGYVRSEKSRNQQTRKVTQFPP